MNPLLQSVQLALQNAEQKEAIAFIDKVVDFCIEKENGKVLDGWPRDLIQLLVAYHMAKDTFIAEQDAEGNILGVFMWYNCDEEDDWFFVQNWESDKEASARPTLPSPARQRTMRAAGHVCRTSTCVRPCGRGWRSRHGSGRALRGELSACGSGTCLPRPH